MNPQKFQVSRRRFLQSSMLAGAGLSLPAWYAGELAAQEAPATPRSAKDKPGIALIGCGGMGRGDGNNALRFGEMRAVCDVDQGRLAEAKEQFAGAEAYTDFRKVLERDDVEVVICGTQDHWHALVSMGAMRAGKDVYCEKPLTLTIEEGQRMVETQRATKRVLQTGSQQRSDERFRLACELVRNGRVGRLRRVAVRLPAGRHGGPFSESPAPEGLDWDLWLGPREQVPYVKEKCHGTFRYWYDYSGGTMTDWGAHHNDIALWGMGLERSGPVRIEGRPRAEMIPGGYTAASEYEVRYTYANGVTHTCESVASDGPDGRSRGRQPGERGHGVMFEGSDGWIFVTRGQIEASDPDLIETALPASAERLYVSNDHMGNFFERVRSRKAPVCDVEIGHRSATICHLGVIAIRLGRELQWDPEREVFTGDAGLNAWKSREMRAPWTYDAV
jgi:predicted dehydrogenase